MKYLQIGKSITDRSKDSLKLYFKDVSKETLITPEDERELALKIRQGDEKALEKLVKANLRFVISIAKQYQGKGLPLEDLIAEGNYGCIKAARLFNPDRGIKFISYAVWWIRQSIMQAISEQSRTVRLPNTQVARIIKINKVTSAFEQINERPPSIEELADLTDIPEDKILQVMDSSKNCISVDTPFNNDDEDSGTLLDVIPNGNSEEADANIMNQSLSDEILNMLDSLSLRESTILKMFFGIGLKPVPFDEIGLRFGLTGERVRQIKEGAIKTLSRNYNSNLEKIC